MPFERRRTWRSAAYQTPVRSSTCRARSRHAFPLTPDSSPHIYRLGNEPSDFYAPGDEVEAAPHRDADGQFRNANTFQIYSMGPDGQPNTEDDMGNWTK